MHLFFSFLFQAREVGGKKSANALKKIKLFEKRVCGEKDIQKNLRSKAQEVDRTQIWVKN